MAWYSLLAIYVIVWWLVLFAVLPFGVRTQAEEGETVLGSATSAPARPMLVRKAIVTSIVAAVVVGAWWVLYVRFGVTVDSLGRMFGPQPVARP